MQWFGLKFLFQVSELLLNVIVQPINLPRKVALGELYVKYSLFLAQAGNSVCLMAPLSSLSSSTRFQGKVDSVAVGVVTRFSPVIIIH